MTDVALEAKIDEGALSEALTTYVTPALARAEHWKTWFMPAVSDAVDAMIAGGHVPSALAEALGDAGYFLVRVSEDIFAERARRGLPDLSPQED